MTAIGFLAICEWVWGGDIWCSDKNVNNVAVIFWYHDVDFVDLMQIYRRKKQPIISC